jgi:hypothetical protein
VKVLVTGATGFAGSTIGADLKFRLVREDFRDAVAWVARILPTRPMGFNTPAPAPNAQVGSFP